ncbi:MAG TPA: RIP metalloprotease RseP [Rhodospirillaceae bacterium]|nr:RIP metalloprotease RseP [Rhodospirillaceae bacterium]
MEQLWTNIVDFGHYLVPFLVVLSVVVFVHEFGHFWVARRCGVKIETFSIGFGPEIFARVDKKGTRWRVAWLPLGGYVKMFGDADPTSFGPSEDAPKMTAEEKKVAFYTQPVRKRFAIVAAGPGSNYLFAVVVLAMMFLVNGQPYTSTKIATVVENSAAAQAGLKTDDKILSIDGAAMESFEAVRRTISLNAGTPIKIVYEREGQMLDATTTPEVVKTVDRLGMEHTQGRLGIVSTETAFRDLNPASAIRESVAEIWNITAGTLKGVGQMIMGVRGTEELGGPLRIAEMSGKVAKDGVFALFWFIVVISVNLGLINLFPIPLLDGGHLLFYAVEGLRGRPLSERIQEYGARVGAALVLSLMVFATWNDLVHLRVVSYLRDLFS